MGKVVPFPAVRRSGSHGHIAEIVERYNFAISNAAGRASIARAVTNYQSTLIRWGVDVLTAHAEAEALRRAVLDEINPSNPELSAG